MGVSEKQTIKGSAIPLTPEEAPHGFRELLCSKCGFIVQVPISCSDKTCRPCQRRRAGKTYHRITAGMKDVKIPRGYSWKHIVLTQRKAYTIGEGITKVIEAFRKMRADKQWKQRVKGGFYTIEAKRTIKGDAWHVHIHSLALTKRLDYNRIHGMWRKYLGYKKVHLNIEDVRFEDKNTRIAGYLCAYLTKKAQVSAEDENDYNQGMKGRRMISAFGDMHQQTVKKEKKEVEMECPHCGNVEWFETRQLDRISDNTAPERGPPEEDLAWEPAIYEAA